MARKLEEIAAEAMQLGSEARAALAKRLLGSLEEISPEEHERLWVEEAARRYEELKSGTARAIPAEEVLRSSHDATANEIAVSRAGQHGAR